MPYSGSSTFEKGGSAGSKGVDYQTGLLIVSYLNALKMKLVNWKLSTENKRADKFDDIVLEWQNGSVLLQAKSKENRKKITMEDLSSVNPKKSDFSLPKYYFSYEKIKNEFPHLKHIILCTNADLKIDQTMTKMLNNKSALNCDSILHYGNGNYSLYTFSKDFIPVLKMKIEEYYTQNSRSINTDKGAITEESILEFLERLVFYCNYPNGEELNKIIENLVNRMEHSSNLWCKTTSIHLIYKMKDWFQQGKGVYFTETHAKAMFCEIKSDKYCETLEKYKLFFRDDSLIFSDTSQIFHLVTNSVVDVIKTYRFLENTRKRNVLYVNPEDGVAVLKDAVEAFQLPHYVFLIIVWPKLMEQVVIEEICDKLVKTLQNRNYKRIILLSESNNNLIKTLINSSSHEVIARTTTFMDIAEESRERLVNLNNVIFQGKAINLQQLIASPAIENYEQIVSCDILERLIRDEIITVGKEVPQLDEQTERFYVERRFKEQTGAIITEEDIYDFTENLVVISDDAGMGKSTTLTRIANTVKTKYPHLWVLKINLNDYTGVLSQILKKSRKTITVKELLNSKHETKLCTQFEEKVFSMQGKVVLMLDGLDEISPDYTEIILNFVSHCQGQHNFAKMFITTRPHMNNYLEGKLKVHCFTMEPFSEVHQRAFLVRYWSYNLNLDEYQKVKSEKYAWELIEKTHFFSFDFVALPLHAMMLAEIFQENGSFDTESDWQGCKEYINDDREVPKLANRLKITELYNMFIQRKKYIFLDKVNPSGNPAANLAFIKEFEKCLYFHETFAVKQIFDKIKRKLFSYKSVSDDMSTEMLRMGIVQKVGNRIQFIHRTFAEYFVAKNLLREIQNNNFSTEFRKFFLEEMLFYHQYSVINSVLDEFLEEIRESIHTNLFVIEKLNIEKGLLHRVAVDGLVSFLDLILKSMKSIEDKTAIDPLCENIWRPVKYSVENKLIDIQDKVGKTPLHYAAQGMNFKMVQYLVKKDADVNIRDLCST